MLLLLTACARLQALPVESLPEDGPSVTSGPAAVAAGAAADEGVELPPSLVTLDEELLGGLLNNGRDSLLVVNFWATWCGPCVREMDVFRTVAASLEERGSTTRFALVSVDATRDRAAVERFLATSGILLPAYHLATPNPSMVLARTVPGWPDIIPVTLVLEPGGAVRARFDGVLDVAGLHAALRE